MGVKGLWSLLNPVARPVQIESLEGKRLAIDSSIWLYQFQSTMRDKDGRVLVNAHILGFLRRINRLLFHGIKPVFVFDGGAPALKRSTIAERKRRKAGAQQNHAKMAEKLLAAQMRREAVRLAQEAEARREARAAERATKLMDDEVGEQIRADAVYLDELEGRAPPPAASRPTAGTSTAASTDASANVSHSSIAETPEQRRQRFKKYDRYQLPAVEMPNYSTEARPDARLATEAELQQFIDEVAPEDIDVESPEFRALPTEVQYEIIGDLRVRSRQPSGKRLTDMLSRAPTALDFSKEQIRNLSQRNDLTQKLLTVTDMVGKAHLTIPVRVASERNRQYLLVKRTEEEGGGWALGIREGTQEKPIELEPETKPKVEQVVVGDSDDDFSDDLQEVVPVDEDLRQHRRREILEAIAKRYAPAAPARTLDIPAKSFGPAPKKGAQPLFEEAEDDIELDIIPTAHDEALALALQQEELGSDEEVADPALARALALSRRKPSQSPSESDSDEFEEVSLAPSGSATPHDPIVIEESDDEEFAIVKQTSPQLPSERDITTAPAKVNEPSPRTEQTRTRGEETGSAQSIMAAFGSRARKPPMGTSGTRQPVFKQHDVSSDLTSILSSSAPKSASSAPSLDIQPSVAENAYRQVEVSPSILRDAESPIPQRATSRSLSLSLEPQFIDEFSPPRFAGAPSPSPEPRPTTAMEEPVTIPIPSTSPSPERSHTDQVEFDSVIDEATLDEATEPDQTTLGEAETTEDAFDETRLDETQQNTISAGRTAYNSESEDEDAIPWSRSPTPAGKGAETGDSSMQDIDPGLVSDGEMNAAEMEQEEDDYARFIAQITNRDLNEVRTEIDDEIRILNQHTKVALRDSDEITHSMVVQVQTLLKHFGIPYITAPMEAEAQCAKLAELDLVDGIITDDSDVFLFGGTHCFKNIFNEAKYAEVFAATDIERELSLTRDRLISLSYLLGSDYTIGLPGIGPVMALELMANFPGSDGLERFKEWWMKVQRGQDLPVEADTQWKRRFQKRFSGSLFLTTDWLNPFVREAYLHPTTDESEEPFHWGFPRLAALRTYLHEELSWSITKVDDELTPIVQRIAQRGRGGIPRQSTLLPFFDHNAAAGTNFAPRRRTTANVSKRLLSVIKEYREAEARAQGQQPTGLGEMLSGVDLDNPKGVVKRSRSKANVSAPASDDEDAGLDPKPKRRKPAPKRKKPSRKATAESSAAASDAADDL